jgi:broad specificity phosphatase PhoE
LKFGQYPRGNVQAEAEAGVESRKACGQRMLDFWMDMLSEVAQSTTKPSVHILISNHGASIRYLLSALHTQSPRMVEFPSVLEEEKRLPNCSITTIKMQLHEDGRWTGVLLEQGADGHLDKRTVAGDEGSEPVS